MCEYLWSLNIRPFYYQNLRDEVAFSVFHITAVYGDFISVQSLLKRCARGDLYACVTLRGRQSIACSLVGIIFFF
jgi:hypothetical protein